ncbi:MAG: flavin reductase family protein [Epsilonproteobacteria bacterium]|nr:flavin reductase family protein [Campylobacterota bacterium]
MLYSFDNLDKIQKYKLMSTSIIPRPIAWVVTQDEVVNIAPFSYFTGLSSQPPTLLISIGHKQDNTPKDTLYNIRKHKKAVVCMVDTSFKEQLENTKESLAHNESEAEKFSIATTKLYDEYPPMIEGASVAFFCTLYKEVEFEGSTIPVILQIDKMYVKDELIQGDKIEFEDVLARVGASYAKVQKI